MVALAAARSAPVQVADWACSNGLHMLPVRPLIPLRRNTSCQHLSLGNLHSMLGILPARNRRGRIAFLRLEHSQFFATML